MKPFTVFHAGRKLRKVRGSGTTADVRRQLIEAGESPLILVWGRRRRVAEFKLK